LARVYGRLPLGQASREVYDLVLAPLLKSVDSPQVKRLTVVRDGKLEYVPFALLQSGGHHYVIERFALSYAPSATLARAKGPVRSSSRSYLGLAMTFPGGITLEEAVRKQSLAALPNTAREVAAGEQVFGGMRLQDTEATETAFRANASQYEILHLATHTLIDDRNPLYSRLLLHPSAQDDQDGMLHTYELFGLDLNAGLVILSACNTGRGSLQKGEGMMSLARGFAYAGCPSILMTHWTVNDRQSADLMAAFFRGLAEGLPKDLALQQAQLAYLAEADEITGHPWYWAAPGLVGEVTPLAVRLRGGVSWWIWVLLGVLVVLVVLGVLWWLKVRKNSMQKD
jgi:CHAT domain-containing protein